MKYKVGVWFGDKVLTDQEADAMFAKIAGSEQVQQEFTNLYSFYNDLGDRYPELEMLSEDDQEDSPWSCSHEHSGFRVIMTLMNDRAAEVSLFIRSLARKHGLICYDPQEGRVYLPTQLLPEPDRALAMAASQRLASV